jgi:hypothetical protein
MSWHAREKAVIRARRIARPTIETQPPPPAPVDDGRGPGRLAEAVLATTPRRKKPEPMPRVKVRVYRIAPGCWEVTNGLTTARTSSAEAAWRLLADLERTA